MLLVNLFVTNRVFQVIARTRQREIFTAAALLIVVGVTALMQAVGLSPALGAFLAGVVLGGSEYRRELETDIEPFRGLFLGLFFITIGAGMDLAAVAREPLMIAGLTVGLMLVKGAVIFGLVRAFGSNLRDSGATAVALAQGGEFAFVLFGFTVAAGVLPADVTALLTVVVALSMALTPLLVIAYARLPLGLAPAAPEREPDVIDETRPDAIIAGFGRFGQVVGRVLIANGYRTVVLESSAEQIELLRRFGRRVYYGDATRLDLLRAAGAEQARLLVVAIDNRDKAVDLVRVARAEFPELVVIARAWDRRHAYQLQDAGAHVVERETFEGGLHMAEEALKRLGMRAHQAHRAARIFRRHDVKGMQELAPLWDDEERYVVASRESSRAMEQVLAQDLQDLRGRIDDDAWDVDSLYRELREEAAEEAAAERRPDPAQP